MVAIHQVLIQLMFCVCNHFGDEILERYVVLKNCCYLPEIVNETTENVDEVSDDFILCGCFYLLKCVF